MNRATPYLALGAALLLAGCGKKSGGDAPPPAFAVPVRALAAAVEPLEEKISLVASLSAGEAIEVRSDMDGTVQSIQFEEGQSVEAGDLLIDLDPGKVEASVAQAEANFRNAEANIKRAESMVANKTISQQEFDQASANFEAARATLELTKQQWKDSRVLARFAGVMGARHVSPGQVIDRTTPLSTLVSLDPIKIEFRAPERFIGQVAAGQAVEFRVAAYTGETFRGEVYFVDPQVAVDTRTVLVKARAQNVEHRLKPGMFGNLDLILRVRDNAVLVPESALVQKGDDTSVFVVNADNTVGVAPVQTGVRIDGRVEITSGLKGGETVIHEGTQKVYPGATVAITKDAAP
ncbi:MAG TPA: efflux RND transporter periplasmic adaptor subunit [Kiritimatiellia bacterium]|jgi:membrane fusion protein (multidrug efflux system)